MPFDDSSNLKLYTGIDCSLQVDLDRPLISRHTLLRAGVFFIAFLVLPNVSFVTCSRSKPLPTRDSPPPRERHETRINAFPPAEAKAHRPRRRQYNPQANDIRVLPGPRLLALNTSVVSAAYIFETRLRLTFWPPERPLSRSSEDCDTALMALMVSEKSPSWSPKKLG
jgi:hypothetical protein